jgi:hypothetical protein
MTTPATATPAAPKPPTLTDPVTGLTIDAFLGGDPMDKPLTSTPADRGDAVEAPVIVTTPAPTPDAPDPAKDAAAVVPEPATEPAIEPAAAPPTKERPPIPYDRFREVNQKKKDAEARAEALEAELAKLKAGNAPAAPTEPAAPAYDFAAKETEYVQLILDGQAPAAAALRAEIDKTRTDTLRAELTAQATTTATTTLTASQTKQRIETLATEFAEKYPALDGESEDFNEIAVADLEAFYMGYMRNGTDPVTAFTRAVDAAVKIHGLGAPPAPPAPVAPKRDVAPRVNVPAQPPATTAGKPGATGGFENIDVTKLSDKEFAQLPEAIKAKLRGDTID